LERSGFVGELFGVVVTLRKSGSGRNSFHKQFDYLSWLVSSESVDRGNFKIFSWNCNSSFF